MLCHIPAKSIQDKIHSLFYRGGKEKREMVNQYLGNSVVKTQILDPLKLRLCVFQVAVWLLRCAYSVTLVNLGKWSMPLVYQSNISFKIILFMYFLEREGKEKERERNINVLLPLTHPMLGSWFGTQACALDWELNQ